jgi:superfamily II DNA or RNA helicase
MPAYKNKMWDGNIRLFSTYDRKLYAGLADYLAKFSQDRGYPFTLNMNSAAGSQPDREALTGWLKEMNLHASGKPIFPHDYQIDGIQLAITRGRCLLLSPTASGKSLIIYCIIRHLLEQTSGKILIVVPTIGLVNQMFSDFKDYSTKNGWDADKMCHTIFTGKEKRTSARVVISTWQSIFRMKEDFFSEFTGVIGDECHQFKAKSLSSIMEKCKNAFYRIGTTGTLDGTQTHKLVIEGLFGKVERIATTKNLMEKNLLSDLSIECITLKYSEEERKECKGMKYADEIRWLTENRKRNAFISKMAVNLKGNTLVLFQFIEHGKTLFAEIERLSAGNNKCFIVYGATEADAREEIRKLAEENNNAIIVASYGTFSTGISIRRLHNVIFASPSKSRIRVLQSIGRQLRKSEHKTCARLFDIGDDLTHKSRRNHTLKHMTERLNLYIQEKFDYRLVRIEL